MSRRDAGIMFGAAVRAVARSISAWENSGAAAVEFALFVPFFMLVIAGTFNLWYLTYTGSKLTAAVSAGSLYAANNAALVSISPSALQSNIETIVASTNGPSWAVSTVNVNNGDGTHCYCPTGGPGSWNWGAAVACGDPCASGGVAGQFVTIMASRALSPLFPNFGLTYSGTISRSALVETK
jgi:Flp pilus assembly protein TadG